jgi:hypothetical protein
MEFKFGNAGKAPPTYDLIDSGRAVVIRNHTSHKRNIIKCSSAPVNLFHVLKLVILTKKMEKNLSKELIMCFYRHLLLN